MKRVPCIILIAALLLSGLFFVRSAYGTTVGGTLTSDTHWTQMDSPINFNGTVIVSNNVTLTIDPGVTVNLGFYALAVSGTLMAAGAANNQIMFTANAINGNFTTSVIAPIIFGSSSTPWSDATNSGSIIQNANLNGIYLQISSSPKIDNCVLNFPSSYQSAISISGGSPIISDNTIAVNSQGSSSSVNSINIYAGNPLITNNVFQGVFSSSKSCVINVNLGAPTISNNLFEGVSSSSNNNGITVNSGTPLITNNQFEGNGYLNAIISSSSNSFTISNNTFSNCLTGITAQAGSRLTVDSNSFLKGNDGLDIAPGASLTITHNLINGNSNYGINGGGYIDSNTITNNKIGIHNPSEGTISNNNIVGNTVNSITATTTNVDAENNWWGIADAETINRTIYDAKVDNTLGTVTFVPFLTQPSLTAPAIPTSTPTITPVPTQVPTPTPAETPIMTTPTPYQYSQSFFYQISNVNMNWIVTATAIMLVLTWLIVILGYAAKSSISKYRKKKS